LHDPPVSCRSLIDLTYPGCPQLLQPRNQFIEARGLTVDVDVREEFGEASRSPGRPRSARC
jgi:hypothetical protein